MNRGAANDIALEFGRGGLGGSTREELRKLAIETLEAVARGEVKRGAMARVASAKALLDATKPDVRAQLLELLNNDRAAYVRWLRAELAECEGKGKVGGE